MNHQPFENWLLSEEVLTPEQSKMLREHLWTCESCQHIDQSWAGVRQLMRKAEPVAPAPGFTLRWHDRLAEERRKKHQRQSWLLLGVTGGLALALCLVWLYQMLNLVGTPQQWLMLGIYQLSSLYFLWESSADTLSSFLRPLFGVIPFMLWILAIGVVSIFGVLWIVAYQKIIAFWRIRA